MKPKQVAPRITSWGSGLLAGILIGVLVMMGISSQDLGAWATIFAAFLGFLGGTFINHKLTLTREKRREELEARAVATLLASELQGVAEVTREHVALNEQRIKGWRADADGEGCTPEELTIKSPVVGLYPVVGTPAFDASVARVGMLPIELVRDLTEIYQRIATWRRLEAIQPRRWLSTYIENQPRTTASVERMEDVAKRLFVFAGMNPPREEQAQ